MLSEFKKRLGEKGEVYLKVKVNAGSGKTQVKELMKNNNEEIIKLDVAAPPVKGKANQEIVKFLAKEFGVNKSGIKIISGAGEKIKLVKITK